MPGAEILKEATVGGRKEQKWSWNSHLAGVLLCLEGIYVAQTHNAVELPRPLGVWADLSVGEKLGDKFHYSF